MTPSKSPRMTFQQARDLARMEYHDDRKEFLDWVHAQLKKRYEQNLKQNNKRK